MTAYTAFLLILAVLAPLPWIALYRLDRAGRAKGVRAVANPWGKRQRPVPPLDRRSRDAGPSRRSRGSSDSGGPHMQNAPPRTPCRDAARRDA